MKRRWLGWCLAAAVAGSVAMAQGPGGEPVQRPEGQRDLQGMQAMRLHWLLGNDEAIQEIGLTTQQVVALKTIRLETSKQMIDLEAKRQHALLAETELISQEAPNEDAVLKTVEETGAVQIEIAKLRVKSLLKMLKILNAEQRAKLTEVFKRRMEDRRNRFERRQEGRGRNPNQPLAEQPVAAPVATPAATP